MQTSQMTCPWSWPCLVALRAIAMPCIWAGPLVWSQPIQALARPTAQQLLSPSMKAILEIRQVWQRCKVREADGNGREGNGPKRPPFSSVKRPWPWERKRTRGRWKLEIPKFKSQRRQGQLHLCMTGRAVGQTQEAPQNSGSKGPVPHSPWMGGYVYWRW